MQLKNQIRVAIVLGILSLVAGVLGHLALTDIYHGDGNLSLEWNVLRVCAVVLAVFTVYALVTLRQILKNL